MPSISRPGFLLAFALLSGVSATALAERADREKPVNIEADKVTVDDTNKVNIFEGHVTLTQGTEILRCTKLVVTQDPAGFYRAVATGGPEGLAYFREKREGKNEYVEGEAERIEHDSKLEQTELFNRAWVRSGKDEVRSNYIFVDGKTSNYAASSGPNGTTVPGGRVHAVILPTKGADSKQAVPALKPSEQLPAGKR